MEEAKRKKRGRPKTVWLTTLPVNPVNWACFNIETRKPSALANEGPWARYVVLPTLAPDGRELRLLLTPAEAKAYAGRIIARADAVLKMNAEHDDGHAPDAAHV